MLLNLVRKNFMKDFCICVDQGSRSVISFLRWRVLSFYLYKHCRGSYCHKLVLNVKKIKPRVLQLAVV